MADKDNYNDEYQFNDLDAIAPDSMDETAGVDQTSTQEEERSYTPQTNVKRNALIVVVLVILAMIIYKFLGSHFSQKPIPAKTQESVAPMPPKPQPVAPVPVSLLVPPKPALVDPDLQNRLSALEQGQQNMRSDVTSLSNQLSGISANVTALTTQLEQLNQTISALSSKVEEQSHDIARLTVVRTHKPARPVVRKIIHTKKYNIQAVIPGRAWLIATNGTTLTVREGTVIPGYGTVRLIDPNQGRVLTSSGQVIRFSQDDS